MITYLKGDATEPREKDGLRIIAHCCNNIGVYGGGFTAALDRKWPSVGERYREWVKNAEFYQPTFGGSLQIVQVEKDIYVANMIGQHGIIGPDNPHPVSYEWIFSAMTSLDNWIENYKDVKFHMGTKLDEWVKFSIHAPRFCAGLAGGSWDVMEPLINIAWGNQKVYIYDLE